MSLTDKRILVIGGGSGIGFAVAEAAANAGAQVTIASSNADKVATAASRIGNHTVGAKLDVTREDEVAAFFEGADVRSHRLHRRRLGRSAARAAGRARSRARQCAVFDVRFWGAVKVAKHAAKTMPAGGSLTLTDGMIAHRPQKGSAISTAMTGAVEHLTRALAVEFAPVRVNAVCPGLIRTGIWDRIPEERREKELSDMTSRQLLARVGEPNEVAEAYLYLMRGGYTTGQVLYVEGGRALTG